MALKAADLEAELIETVCTRVRERISADDATACEEFVRQYYHWVPAEDLAERRPVDLYGAAVAHWNLAQQRSPGEANVRVYNPDYEQHGWQSPHTVVEIVADDMAFMVDSVTIELGRHGIDLVIRPVMRIRRDGAGRLIEILEPGADAPDAVCESVMHVEVVRELDRVALAGLRDSILRVLGEVRAAVEDWGPMRARSLGLAHGLDEAPAGVDAAEVREAQAFLEWLAQDNFVFLGYREYSIDGDPHEVRLHAVPDSGLGILRGAPVQADKRLTGRRRELAIAPHILVLTKANSRATVHRPAFLDYIGVKQFDAGGHVVTEHRLLGLYTHTAYRVSPRAIPQLRGKVGGVLARAAFAPDSHDEKALLEIVESYPRDALFQVGTEELFAIAMGLLGLGERQRVRLFVSRDALDRFVSCLVTIPRDRFNTENRERVERILKEAFDATDVDFTIQVTESVLVRLHYVVHCPDGVPDYDPADIERRLIEAARAWTDDLRDALIEEHGEDQGTKLSKRYERAFPTAYRADWMARSAIADIGRIEELARSGEPILSLYRPLEAHAGIVRCKLFSAVGVSLSDVLPSFEHMGAQVVDERPYEITPDGAGSAWIYDFRLRCAAEDIEPRRDILQEAFLGVWRGDYEDDGLNGLVLRAGLSGREITIVRGVARYLRQAGIAFSDRYMERTLTGHPITTTLLVRLFQARFDPDRRAADEVQALEQQTEAAIDAVESLDEDRIMRSFLSVIRAMLRTNYFRTDQHGSPRPYLSFKLDPTHVALLALPRPQFEIFVYSPRVEGVHLRGGAVARGGLRWSDRKEDFRTEVLGLMKAQMVKNALIVPVGSKGGFVVKRPPAQGGREAIQNEAIACYTTFLAGLLDLTDNIVGGEVITPERVVRYDDHDPYLVVAADKGTASFSDIANEVSRSYGFWLGDAFASGGSKGYDHKQMGITARGAWESVKRHFRELGTDVQTTDFTVVGVGDMSGDVFGNGMLLSRHIRLLAAFNHLHVFIDPDPDPEASFAERKRLFGLPRSSWGDYDARLISEGGGVFARTAKSVPISPRAREALGIEADELSPNELIRELLRAPVDLLWNGGIGTYVKASTEAHADAGDKANDALRVDAGGLRCRVVGEGGNLGFTQRGRIEYALAGGAINTDAIDNVAGVNCSDHEVNIKILLDGLVADGDMTVKQRNELLAGMTDAVADRLLHASYTQTQAISLALAQAGPMIDVHARLIRHLEQVAGLHRELEFLPSEETIAERKAVHEGLVAPELAVMMAYCKIRLYARLLESDLPEDPYLSHDLERYFPPPLGPGPESPDRPAPERLRSERFSQRMHGHRLRREIIATVVANQIVDRCGTTFTFRLGEETGASPSMLARGYAVAREVFEMRSFWSDVERLDNVVDAHVQVMMLIDARRLVERATRWLVRANPQGIDIEATMRHFAPAAQMLARALPGVLDADGQGDFAARVAQLRQAAMPAALAERVAGMPSLLSVLDIVAVADATDREPEAVMATYFGLGSRLELNWLRDRIFELPRANRWQGLARAALRDDLNGLHRSLTREVIEASGPAAARDAAALDAWLGRNADAVQRCLGMLSDVRASRTYDTTTLPVALREIRNLIRGRAPVQAGD